MFKHFKLLFAFLFFTSFIVEDAAGGGDDSGDDDIDDIDITDDIDDENIDDTDKKAKANSNNANGTDSTSLQSTVKDLQARIQARDDADLLAATLSDLGKKHQGFDSNKVKEYLIELNKKDPERANSLNNPIGFENVWLTEFKENSVKNDSPNYGRNVTPVDRSEEVLEKVKNGEVLTLQDELSYYGNEL